MKLVILDRDGVINYESKDYIKSPSEWKPIPGSLKAIARLHEVGYRVVVATNQSGIGRGYYTEEDLARIHQKMEKFLNAAGAKLDSIFYCPHSPEKRCFCRKPAIGLFQRIAHYYKQSLEGTIAVGDSLCDVQAAKKMSCKPYLVLTGNGKQTLLDNPNLLKEIPIFSNLWAAVNHMITDE